MDNSRRSRKKGTKKKKHPLILLLIFLVGFAVAIYPLVSRYYYRIESNEVIKEFDETVSQMDKAELEERWRLAQAFNATLKSSEILDPFTEQEKKKGVSEYANMLKVHERIGYVEIPAIDQEIPMYVGTSEEILQKGAGLLEGASLPVGGENTHTVVTAHRGLPTAELFSQLDKMKKGDVFYLHVLDQVLAYQVDQILTVEPNDFEPVLIQHGEDYATLLTCTPYMINSHRLLVRGKRIPYTAPIAERNRAVRERGQFWLWLLLAALVMILVLSYGVYRHRRIVKGLEKQLEEHHVKG
ncbi:TPA: PI-1 pilus system sortase SrtC-2 [Streptococcus pneumoniae]